MAHGSFSDMSGKIRTPYEKKEVVRSSGIRTSTRVAGVGEREKKTNFLSSLIGDREGKVI